MKNCVERKKCYAEANICYSAALCGDVRNLDFNYGQGPNSVSISSLM